MLSTLKPLLREAALRAIPPLRRALAERERYYSLLMAAEGELKRVSRLVDEGGRYFPVAPSRCVLPGSAPPADIAARLAETQMALVTGVLPAARAAAVRAETERRMAGSLGNNLCVIYANRLEAGGSDDSRAEIDVSVLLHLLDSPCLAIARAFFERTAGTPECLLPLRNLLIRKYDARQAESRAVAIPWHQDLFKFPAGLSVLNFWTLLSPDECGTTSPGLEFIPDAMSRAVAREANPTSTHYHFLETDHAAVARYLDLYDPWQPSIALGDVMIFSELALHRTYIAPTHAGVRHSAEIRLVGRSRAAIAELGPARRPGLPIDDPDAALGIGAAPEADGVGAGAVAPDRQARLAVAAVVGVARDAVGAGAGRAEEARERGEVRGDQRLGERDQARVRLGHGGQAERARRSTAGRRIAQRASNPASASRASSRSLPR